MKKIIDTNFYRPSPSKAKVTEDSARTANATYSYTGTVRTVGSGKTHATLTAAYAACSTGDIIEVYGTIDITAEAGGYWLINTAKNVLVRGSTSNAADTVLSKVGGASGFGVRIRVNSGIVFKDLTFYTDHNAPSFYNDADEANRNMICDNVRFIQINTGASATWMSLSGTAPAQVRYFEFKNCYFERLGAGASIPLNVVLPSPNNTFLFTGCTFNVSGATMRVHQTFDGTFIMYDNSFTQRSSDICVQFGYDTTIPTSTIGLVDYRGNKITFLPGFSQHGLLLGRGTDDVYCYNNEMYMHSVNDANSIGIVVKTTSSSVGNSIIKGDFCYAPRPFYIKGGSNVIVSNNVFVSNNPSWEAFGFANHKNGADEVLSRYNVITNNVFTSKGQYPVYCYNDGTAETTDVSFKTCSLSNNSYYSSTGKYLYDAVNSIGYTFSNVSSFWGSSGNEIPLHKINGVYIPNFS